MAKHMVQPQREVTPVDKMVKFLHGEDESKCFLLDLTLFLLGRGQVRPITPLSERIREGHIPCEPCRDSFSAEMQSDREGRACSHLRRAEVPPFCPRASLQLKTDHKPLLAIFGSKKGVPTYRVNHLQRWAMTLLDYNFTVEYVNTKGFGQADALSRLIATQPLESEYYVTPMLPLSSRTTAAIFLSLPKPS